jgi:hypothetical protein
MTDPYRVLVTGSRDWKNQQAIWDALATVARELPADRDLVLVHGACPTGADQMADEWGQSFGATIERHPARDFGPWPACGPFRNKHMVSLGADTCLAFIGPCTKPRCHRTDPHTSHGASHCARLAEQAGIPVRRITA